MKKKLSLVLLLIVSMFSLSFSDSHGAYVVKEGDTLAKIASNYEGVTYNDIAKANNISNLNFILAGQKLVIPINSGENVENEGRKNNLVILHTNDTHSRIKSGKYAGMGFAAIATKVNEFRANNKNVLLLDAGDSFHGQVISQLNEGESVVKVMNTMKYDAMVAGNHDFNYGQERLIEIDRMTDFPILASNIIKEDGKKLLSESRIIYKDGLRIGIFGLATPETLFKTHPDNVKGLDFINSEIVAQQMVDKLSSQTDIIIALSHLGIDTSKNIPKTVKGIDLIVDGHSHTALEEGMIVNDTLIVQAGEHDKNLGIVSFSIKDKVIISKKAKLFTKKEAESIKENIDIVNAVEDIEKENEKITSEVVGTSDKLLNGERASVRTDQTNLGNLITKAMIEATDADVALTNGGGIRASIDPGPVTKGDIITVLPFGNYVVKQEITGEVLLGILEHGLYEYPKQSGSFAHTAGMKIKFDSSKEPGNRIVEVMINGELLDEEKKYTIATNDFLAAGGDNYPKGLKIITEYSGLDEILVDWMQENGTKGAEVDDRLIDVSNEISFRLVEIFVA